MLSKEQLEYATCLTAALIDVGHTDTYLSFLGAVASLIVRRSGKTVAIGLNDWALRQPVRKHLETVRCVLGPTELERSFN
jgi:hypothetical protein